MPPWRVKETFYLQCPRKIADMLWHKILLHRCTLARKIGVCQSHKGPHNGYLHVRTCEHRLNGTLSSVQYSIGLLRVANSNLSCYSYSCLAADRAIVTFQKA